MILESCPELHLIKPLIILTVRRKPKILKSRQTKELFRMKTTMKLFLAVAVIMFVSCGQTKKETTAKDVEKEVREAVDATQDYASDKLG